VRLVGLGQLKKTNDIVGNRIRDLPACSTVPQQITLPRAPPPRLIVFTCQTHFFLARASSIVSLQLPYSKAKSSIICKSGSGVLFETHGVVVVRSCHAICTLQSAVNNGRLLTFLFADEISRPVIQTASIPSISRSRQRGRYNSESLDSNTCIT
jgi:hypothetical protein